MEEITVFILSSHGPGTRRRGRVMRPVSTSSCLTTLLLSSLLLGCRTAPKGPLYPADPLFAIKKPQVAKAADAAPQVVADATPGVPAVPAVILAARQTPPSPSAPPGYMPEQGDYRVGYPPGPSR